MYITKAHFHTFTLTHYYMYTLTQIKAITSGRLAARRWRLWRSGQGPRRVLMDRGSRREERECVRARRW